jgi:hypothetical protein
VEIHEENVFGVFLEARLPLKGLRLFGLKPLLALELNNSTITPFRWLPSPQSMHSNSTYF